MKITKCRNFSSYKVSFRIALHGKAHTVAENSIKPGAKDLVESIIGINCVRNKESVPLSINRVSRCTTNLSEYCRKAELVNSYLISSGDLYTSSSQLVPKGCRFHPAV